MPHPVFGDVAKCVCVCVAPLSKSCGTTRLDRLDLVESKRGSVEAGGQVVAVKVVALGRIHWAKLGASSAANTGLGLDGLAEGTELLSMVTVGAEAGVGRSADEGVGEGVGRRLRVRLTAVVDGSCVERLMLVYRKTRGLFPCSSRGRDVPGIVRFPMNRMEGVRSAC